MPSLLLNINDVLETQNNKYITINNAVQALEYAANRVSSTTVGGSDVTINQATFVGNASFVFSGITGANRTVNFPSTVNGNTTNRVIFVENNDSTFSLTITSGAGSTVTLRAGQAAVIRVLGTSCVAIANRPATDPYDIGVFYPGQPTDNAAMVQLVAVRAFQIPVNMSGSRGFCGINPNATATLNVQRNAVTFGTISISTGGVFTFTAASAANFAIGDRLTIRAPSPADPTLSDIGVMLRGTRTGD